MSEEPQEREDSEAGSYAELHAEVDRSFGGSWEAFLKAVSNPAEILYFVLWRQCGGKAHKLEAWAKDKKIPEDWLPRFYGMLTPKGEFQGGVETRAPKPPPEAAQSSEAAAQAAPEAEPSGSAD